MSAAGIATDDDLETEGPPRWRVVTTLVAVVVALALVAGALWWWLVRPPYGPQAMAARATVEVVTAETELAALRRLGGAEAEKVFLAVEPGRQLIVGQVTWTVPDGASDDGQLAVLVIHKPTNAVAPTLFGAGARVGQGWDGRLDAVGHEYDWLSAVRGGQAETALTAPGDAILAPADAPGPVTFVAQFRPEITQLTADDVLVALVLIGPRGQLYWAERLLG
ncbi:hypothetical protein GCM10009682_33860 [Luedemannella flava]|uniref:SURF1-like protein n=1 Tax=Luedemannella flava TaxID=349316 RepID=A0ABP4YCQ9_9ACTN